MKGLLEYRSSTSAMQSIGALAKLIEQGQFQHVEHFIAALALWLLDLLEAGRITPNDADEVMTLLDVYLTDHPVPELSSEAQELLFEGELFHHYGTPEGPDPQHLRRLAAAILERGR